MGFIRIFTMVLLTVLIGAIALMQQEKSMVSNPDGLDNSHQMEKEQQRRQQLMETEKRLADMEARAKKAEKKAKDLKKTADVRRKSVRTSKQRAEKAEALVEELKATADEKEKGAMANEERAKKAEALVEKLKASALPTDSQQQHKQQHQFVVPTTSSTQREQQFNFLPWTERPQGHDEEVAVVGLEPSSDGQITVYPGMEFNISYANATMRVNPPYVVMYGPTWFTLEHISEVSKGLFVLKFPGQMDPGPYEMHILIYHPVEDQTKKMVPFAVPGSPFQATVVPNNTMMDPSGRSNALRTSKLETVASTANPSTFTVSAPPCTSGYYSKTTPGRWIRATPENQRAGMSTRDGWIWAPFACHFEMHHPIWKLPYGNKPLWIVVLGTSTTRGLFFEMLDMILTEHQLEKVDIEEFWKCWGYLDLRVGNLRISYRDQRLRWPDDLLAPGYRDLMIGWLHQNICPGHKNATTDFSPWFDTRAEGFPLVPDVVVAESPVSVEEQSPGCFEEYEQAGGLYIPIAHKPRTPSFAGFESDKLSAKYEEAGKHFLDIWAMARPGYNNGRSEPNARDIHYVHTGHCYSDWPNSTHACSAVMEMEVLMLLHIIRQERKEFFESASSEFTAMFNEPKPATICRQCPKTMGYFDKDPIPCQTF